MILSVCALFDMKARAFASPFVVAHLDLAKRAMKEAIGIPGHSLNKWPEDYVLYCLGTWNDETAEYQLHSQRQYVVSALELNGRDAPKMPTDAEGRN